MTGKQDEAKIGVMVSRGLKHPIRPNRPPRPTCPAQSEIEVGERQ